MVCHNITTSPASELYKNDDTPTGNVDGKFDGAKDSIYKSVDQNKSVEEGRVNGKADKLNGLQYMTLAIMCVMIFFCYTCFSLIAPFYPGEAQNKGLSMFEIGFVFASYELSCFITNPIFGYLVPLGGAKFMYVAGTMFRASCEMLFAFTIFGPDGSSFFWIGFIVRFFAALGSASYTNARAAIVLQVFPAEKISTIWGILNTFTGVGLMVGPPLGGVLYAIGGFTFPFLLLGGISLLVSVFAAFVLPSINNEYGDDIHNNNDKSNNNKTAVKAKQVTYRQVMGVPAMIINTVVTVCIWPPLTAFQPFVEIHLDEFGLSSVEVGFLFLLQSVAYVIGSPLFGWIFDKWERPRALMMLGLLVTAAGCLLIGPTPYLPLQKSVVSVTAGMILSSGLGPAILNGVTFKDSVTQCLRSGLPDNAYLHGRISGLYFFGMAFGQSIGPIVGSPIVDEYGLPTMATLLTYFVLSVALAVVLFTVWENKVSSRRKLTIADDVPETLTETLHLLSDSGQNHKRRSSTA